MAMNKDDVVNNSYELLNSKYSDFIKPDEKNDIIDIISQLHEISETLKSYKLDHSISPFNAKPLE
jgi:hypothetical protein